ncbi:MAG: response regulator [Spirochaetia bacterium]|nr:response regulator [Spirochaetia bacterium]
MNQALTKNNLDTKSSKILVVDDEATNVRLLEKMLAAVGYEHVLSTQDPREVENMLRKDNSDLILLDINMPYMDGYQVMDHLNTLEDLDIPPILVLTAQGSKEYRQRALDGGARDYITKPFDMDELTSRVRNLLEVHLAQKMIKEQNKILDQKVEERTHQLQIAQDKLHDSRLQIVRRLGRAAEYRDNETGLHIIRMSKISALLGASAGLNEYECDLLLNASPMHDIGKIGIPDNVLLKPGKLTKEEFEVIQSHPQIGANILAEDESDLLKMAHDIALTHHEKWDGSGYPAGLKGEEIPLSGRIAALADVYDALTSRRPYKEPWPVEKAVEYIKENSGKHFDPSLVEKFLELLPEILKISSEFREPDVA